MIVHEIRGGKLGGFTLDIFDEMGLTNDSEE
jgi:hypothetical protein